MPIEQLYVAQIPYAEIYRRLGYTKNTQLPTATKNKIDISIQIAAALCSARAASKIIPKEELQKTLEQSKDLAKFLKDAHTVLLLGITVGPQIIAARDELLKTDPGTGIIYDAVGSEMVEEALNIYQRRLRQTLQREGKTLSVARYSPGYGDCPIQVQELFFKLLPMHDLGVTLTPSYIMQPEKTITAFADIG